VLRALRSVVLTSRKVSIASITTTTDLLAFIGDRSIWGKAQGGKEASRSRVALHWDTLRLVWRGARVPVAPLTKKGRRIFLGSKTLLVVKVGMNTNRQTQLSRIAF